MVAWTITFFFKKMPGGMISKMIKLLYLSRQSWNTFQCPLLLPSAWKKPLAITRNKATTIKRWCILFFKIWMLPAALPPIGNDFSIAGVRKIKWGNLTWSTMTIPSISAPLPTSCHPHHFKKKWEEVAPTPFKIGVKMSVGGPRAKFDPRGRSS